MLFLIIFAWTPPHFWSLALYRTEDYAKAGVPMLPVTHGKAYTRLQVLLYTLILFGVSLMPYVDAHERRCSTSSPRSRWAAPSSAMRCASTSPTAMRSRSKTFRYSILYLAALFAALLVDHYSASLALRQLAFWLPAATAARSSRAPTSPARTTASRSS